MKRVSSHLRRVLLGSAFFMSVVVSAPVAGEGTRFTTATRHQANIKFGDVTFEVLSFSWDDTRQGKNIRKPPNRASSDSGEGGEVVRDVQPADSAQAQSGSRLKSKVNIGDMIVTKPMDKASAMLAEPLPSGSATLVVARGALATGKHIPIGQITIRGRTYELQGVEVTGCTALADGTDGCTLTYQSLGQ
jgi:hypothetical protein